MTVSATLCSVVALLVLKPRCPLPYVKGLGTRLFVLSAATFGVDFRDGLSVMKIATILFLQLAPLCARHNFCNHFRNHTNLMIDKCQLEPGF